MQPTDVVPGALRHRVPWLVDAREAVAGWGLLVAGVITVAAGAGGLLLVASSDSSLPAPSTGPVGVGAAAAEGLRLGVLTTLGVLTSVVAVVVALSVLRSGRDGRHRLVLPLVLVPAAVVAAAAGLWSTCAVAVAVVVGVQLLLRPPSQTA